MNKIDPQGQLLEVLVPAVQAFLDTHFANYQASCTPGKPRKNDPIGFFTYVFVTLPPEKSSLEVFCPFMENLQHMTIDLLIVCMDEMNAKLGIPFADVDLVINQIYYNFTQDRIEIQFFQPERRKYDFQPKLDWRSPLHLRTANLQAYLDEDELAVAYFNAFAPVCFAQGCGADGICHIQVRSGLPTSDQPVANQFFMATLAKRLEVRQVDIFWALGGIPYALGQIQEIEFIAIPEEAYVDLQIRLEEGVSW